MGGRKTAIDLACCCKASRRGRPQHGLGENLYGNLPLPLFVRALGVQEMTQSSVPVFSLLEPRTSDAYLGSVF